MIVCVCNALTDKDVEKAVKDGYNSCKKVIAYYNMEYDCAVCCKSICEQIKELENDETVHD